jgi:hypothetical protein
VSSCIFQHPCLASFQHVSAPRREPPSTSTRSSRRPFSATIQRRRHHQ